jgi:hypothetical protein
MQKTFICKNCEEEKPANPRLKGKQTYCGDPECQRARKAAWQREKMAKDADYPANKKESNKKWRQDRPAHQYQRQYRQEHPNYVEANRQKQRLRNQKRTTPVAAEKIVKLDALTNQGSNTYIITPYAKDASGKIVKLDTLLVQLVSFQQDKSSLLPPSFDCKDGPY